MGPDLDFGKIGYTDRGDWSASYNSGQGYEYLDGVTHGNCYWISLDNQNTETPSDSAAKWHKALNGKVATDAATAADAAAASANDAASFAQSKAVEANTAIHATEEATQAANEAAQAALDAVVTAELPAVATESAIRNIVRNYTPVN
jgi:hypothetical protein